MQVHLQLNVEGVADSHQFDAYLRQRLDALADNHPGIEECSVTVDSRPGVRAVQARFVAHIEARTAEETLVATREHDENVFAAVAHALVAMHQQLENLRYRPRQLAARIRARLTATAQAGA